MCVWSSFQCHNTGDISPDPSLVLGNLRWCKRGKCRMAPCTRWKTVGRTMISELDNVHGCGWKRKWPTSQTSSVTNHWDPLCLVWCNHLQLTSWSVGVPGKLFYRHFPQWSHVGQIRGLQCVCVCVWYCYISVLILLHTYVSPYYYILCLTSRDLWKMCAHVRMTWDLHIWIPCMTLLWWTLVSGSVTESTDSHTSTTRRTSIG